MTALAVLVIAVFAASLTASAEDCTLYYPAHFEVVKSVVTTIDPAVLASPCTTLTVYDDKPVIIQPNFYPYKFDLRSNICDPAMYGIDLGAWNNPTTVRLCHGLPI